MAVGWNETAGEQFAPVVDDQMQLKAKAPAHRTPPACRPTEKNLVLVNASIIAHRHKGRIDETDPATLPKQVGQIAAQQSGHTRNELHEPPIAHQVRKLGAQMHLHMLGVVRLEGAVLTLVKMNQKGHHFTWTQPSGTSPMFAIPQALRFHFSTHCLVEIIDMAVKFE